MIHVQETGLQENPHTSSPGVQLAMFRFWSLLLLGFNSTDALLATAPRISRIAPRAASPKRSATLSMVETTSQCAVIDLKADGDPVALAKVLKKAWMEGGMKRGLSGSVVVSHDDTVQIVAKGREDRLKAFAAWCSDELGSPATITMAAACPAFAGDLSMSKKFELAEMPRGKANSPWVEILKGVSDLGEVTGSDEGLV